MGWRSVFSDNKNQLKLVALHKRGVSLDRLTQTQRKLLERSYRKKKSPKTQLSDPVFEVRRDMPMGVSQTLVSRRRLAKLR